VNRLYLHQLISHIFPKISNGSFESMSNCLALAPGIFPASGPSPVYNCLYLINSSSLIYQILRTDGGAGCGGLTGSTLILL